MAYEDFLADLADGMADLLEELGTTVSYQQLPEDPFTLAVLVDDPADPEDLDPAYRRIDVRLSDFAAPRRAPANGDLVTLDGVPYVVQKVGPNKSGMATLTINQTERNPDA
jgi:hypothetical protein